MAIFKDMLKYLRIRDGFSQAELAEKLGVAKSTISMYEVGKREPDFETLEAIADIFNVDMNFLLGKEESEYTQPLSSKDRRDISKDLDHIMTEIRNGEDGHLYYNGTEIDEASINLLENAIEFALTQAKKENKIKYNPNKNKE